MCRNRGKSNRSLQDFSNFSVWGMAGEVSGILNCAGCGVNARVYLSEGCSIPTAPATCARLIRRCRTAMLKALNAAQDWEDDSGAQKKEKSRCTVYFCSRCGKFCDHTVSSHEKSVRTLRELALARKNGHVVAIRWLIEFDSMSL
jgi:hypothetical protein